MNKIFIVILAISIFLISCIKNPNIRNAWSIDESKSRMIFSHAYQHEYVKINDSIEFYIKLAWCEKIFYSEDLDEFGKLKNSIEGINDYRIVMVIDENLKEKYSGFGDNWYFNDLTFEVVGKQNYLISYKADLVSKKPLADTLGIKLCYSTPPDKPNEYWKTHELGSFYLYSEK